MSSMRIDVAPSNNVRRHNSVSSTSSRDSSNPLSPMHFNHSLTSPMSNSSFTAAYTPQRIAFTPMSPKMVESPYRQQHTPSSVPGPSPLAFRQTPVTSPLSKTRRNSSSEPVVEHEVYPSTATFGASRIQPDDEKRDSSLGDMTSVVPGSSDVQVCEKYLNDMTKEIRMAFVRKVYGILLFQLLISCGFIALFTFVEIIGTVIHRNHAIVWGSGAAALVVFLVLVVCGNSLRNFPTNYIFLFVFTVFLSSALGCLAALFDALSVVLAVAMTVLAVAGLTAFACQTKIDMTARNGSLFCLLWVFVVFAVVFAGFGGTRFPRWLQVVYAGVGVLIFSLYIVFDTQLIIGGRHIRHQYSVDDYAFAALSLYLDVANVFVLLLAMAGGSRS